MYARKKSLQGKASASSIPNNLAVNFNTETCEADISFLHKSAVHIFLSGADDSANGYSERHVVCKVPSANQQVAYVLILQADWVQVAGRRILVLATQRGIKMYEWDGSTLIYWHGFGAGGEAVVFTRGIASIGTNTICIGTSSGQILVFSVPSKGGNITFEEYLPGHKHSLCSVASRDDYLVSADENGDIIIRELIDDSAFKITHSIRGEGFPCNCIDVWRDIIVAGFATGEIRLYSLRDGRLLGQIGAHARSINAIHIAQKTGLCLSASEDSFVRVWELSAGKNIEVNHRFSESITDHQLVGGRFTDSAGKSFALTAYDSSEIFRFSQS